VQLVPNASLTNCVASKVEGLRTEYRVPDPFPEKKGGFESASINKQQRERKNIQKKITGGKRTI